MRRMIPLAAATIFLAATLASPGQAQPRYYYGDDCRDQNSTAGAIIGAILGGVLGSQFGRGGGKTAATFGGVILGGLAGAAIAKDINCSDRPYAFRAYAQGFDGPLDRRYDWQNERRTSYGYFRPTREYHNGAMLCRDFQEDGIVNGRRFSRTGSACRHMDGNWHFN